MLSVTRKRATSLTPQVITVVAQDSGSMAGDKARAALCNLLDLVIGFQAADLGTRTFRYLLSIARFGAEVSPICVAVLPREVRLDTIKLSADLGSRNPALALEWAPGPLCRR